MDTVNVRQVILPPEWTMGPSESMIRMQRNKLDYVKASRRWWIYVEFHSVEDALMFRKGVSGAGVRLIDFKDRFFIEDSRISDEDNLSIPERYVSEDLPRLFAAVTIICPHFSPPRVVGWAKVTDKGVVECAGRIISVRVHTVEEFPDIVSFLRGPDTNLGDILQLVSENGDLSKALYFLGAEGNPWVNLYKVHEIIQQSRHDIGAANEPRWCSAKQETRFTRTANHEEASGVFSRHARPNCDPPANPMSINEAFALIREMVANWISYLLAHKHQS